MENRAVIITRATEYAIRAVLYMACQPQGEIVLKKDICRVQEITPAFLTKILQPLIKAGIVGSQRGVGGGFFLAKAPADITLFDIVKTQEGPLYLNQCLIKEGNCGREFFCPVHGAWHEIRNEFMATLSRFNFADLATRQAEMPIPVTPVGKSRRKKPTTA
jgi:Rrf2 family protein